MKKGFLIYFAIWVVTVGAFWLGLGQDAMGYSLLAFYVALPLAAIACSAVIGCFGCSFGRAIIFSLVLGAAYSLAQYLTFSLFNMISISFERINQFSIDSFIGGTITALIGFALGGIIRLIRGR